MTSEKRDNLTSKQRKAIELSFTGMTVQQVADAVGVSLSTLYRWRSDERFRSKMLEYRRSMTEEYIDGLTVLLRDNLNVLASVRDDSKTAASTKIRAVQAIDESLRKWIEVADFAIRLEAIEAVLEGVDDA